MDACMDVCAQRCSPALGRTAGALLPPLLLLMPPAAAAMPCLVARVLDVPAFCAHASRLAPAATAVDGVAQLLLLLPDVVSVRNMGSSSSGGSLVEVAVQADGTADVQQAVLVSLDLLRHLLGSGQFEAAHARGAQLLQAPGQAAAPAGVGGAGRLCVMALVAPDCLGFTDADGERCMVLRAGCMCVHACCVHARAPGLTCKVAAPAAGAARHKLLHAVQELVLAAAARQPELLQQLQTDMLALLQNVVLPALQRQPGALRGAQLTAVSRIITGAWAGRISDACCGCCCSCLLCRSMVTFLLQLPLLQCPLPRAGLIAASGMLPDLGGWPGGALLAPGGQELQQQLPRACLILALSLAGLSPAGGFAAAASGMRAPPQQQLEAADGAWPGCCCWGCAAALGASKGGCMALALTHAPPLPLPLPRLQARCSWRCSCSCRMWS